MAITITAISLLPLAGALTGTELVPLDQVGVTSQSTPSAIGAYVAANYVSGSYVSLAGSYANPTWITSLAWSKITGTPTTLAGYGITDAVAYLASPTFTGVPAAPTATMGTNTTQLATTAFVQAAIGGGGTSRTVLTGNVTRYVSTTGNDSNDGLGVGTPWLTTQHAVNVILSTIDSAGFSVLIQHADGTYAAGANVSVPLYGGGALIVQGNVSTPGNVVFSTGAATCFTTANFAFLTVQYCDLVAATGICLQSLAQSVLYFNNVRFGASSVHISSRSFSLTSCASGAYAIIGGATSSHLDAQNQSQIYINSTTVTIAVARAFGTFCQAFTLGAVLAQSTVFTGAGVAGCTGIRYSVNQNSVVHTAGGGANFFPGNVAGTTSTGGQYV